MGQDPQKMKIVKILFFLVKRLIIMLPTCPQPLANDEFSSRYDGKRVLGPNAQIW